MDEPTSPSGTAETRGGSDHSSETRNASSDSASVTETPVQDGQNAEVLPKSVSDSENHAEGQKGAEVATTQSTPANGDESSSHVLTGSEHAAKADTKKSSATADDSVSNAAEESKTRHQEVVSTRKTETLGSSVSRQSVGSEDAPKESSVKFEDQSQKPSEGNTTEPDERPSTDLTEVSTETISEPAANGSGTNPTEETEKGSADTPTNTTTEDDAKEGLTKEQTEETEDQSEAVDNQPTHDSKASSEVTGKDTDSKASNDKGSGTVTKEEASKEATKDSMEDLAKDSTNSNGKRPAEEDIPLRAEDAVAQMKKDPKRPRTEKTPPTVSHEVTVSSLQVLESVADIPRRNAGFVVYEPDKPLLVGFELDINCIVQVAVAERYLKATSEIVAKRPLWGTEVYTDDSDIVACLIHQNKLTSEVRERGGDLLVSVLVLPPLQKYTGSYMNGLQSRTWLTAHDGVSFMITEHPLRVPSGWSDSATPTSRLQRQIDSDARRHASPADVIIHNA